jgi:phosphomannomutase
MKPLRTVRTMPVSYVKKKLVVFDLDGTLTETKSNMTRDVSALLVRLLMQKRVAVIGGASYAQFERQFLRPLRCPKNLLGNLFVFPTTGTAFYRYRSGTWRCVYQRKLSSDQKKKIAGAFKSVFKKIGYVPPKKTYGNVLEDRGAEMTYSFLGQDVVRALGERGVHLKERWTREHVALKLKIARIVQRLLTDLEVRAAGFTSIDVTKKGIDKAYGIREIEKILKVSVRDMVFIGDALSRGGNDSAARKTGIDCVAVRGPKEAKRVIRRLLA